MAAYGPQYRLNVEKCSFWHLMCDMAATGPQYKLNVEKCTFWHHMYYMEANGPQEKLNGITFDIIFGTIFAVGHQMVRYTD